MSIARKKAIVTLVIGIRFQQMFDAACRPSWKAYCAKYGYDLFVIDKPLDVSPRAQARSPSWQKLLILSQDWAKDYDTIVWVDADVIINMGRARDISDGVEPKLVGGVDAYSMPTREFQAVAYAEMTANWRKAIVERWWSVRGPCPKIFS